MVALRTPVRWMAVATSIAAVLVVPRTASAAPPSDVELCASSSEAAQRLVAGRRLVEAKQKLLVCSRATCPAAIARDCDALLTQVDAALPSIVLRIVDSTGQDVRDVTAVRIDGNPQPSALQGTALPIDPGTHVVRVDRAGHALEQSFVAREGEKDRPLTITIASATPPPPSPEPPSVSRGPPPSGPPWTAYALGGVAVAAAGVFAFLVVDGQSTYETCQSHGCSGGTAASLRIERVASWATLGAAAIAGGASIWLFLNHQGSLRAGTAAVGGAPVLRLAGVF